MTVINPHGLLVDIDPHVFAMWKEMGIVDQVPYINVRMPGAGDERHICLINQMVGIGDTLHAMPALSSLCATHDVAYMGDPKFRLMPESCGARFIDNAEFGDRGNLKNNKWIVSHAREYGAFFYLHSWCFMHDEESGGVPTMTRFQQYAALVNATLPESFNFRAHLGVAPMNPRSSKGKGILFAPQSTSPFRTAHDVTELCTALNKLHPTQIVGIEKRGVITYATLTDLIHAVDNARVVVATDNGILQLALALGKPAVAIMGPTSPEIIVDQFRKYNPAQRSITLQPEPGEWMEGCKYPCNFIGDRGFQKKKKCISAADCMKAHRIDRIVEAAKELLG